MKSLSGAWILRGGTEAPHARALLRLAVLRRAWHRWGIALGGCITIPSVG